MVWFAGEISQEIVPAGGGCERCGRRVPAVAAGELVRMGWRVTEAGACRCAACVRGEHPAGSEVLEGVGFDN